MLQTLKKVLGLIALPLYIIVASAGLGIWCFVLFINQENKAIGQMVKSWCMMIEKFYYKFYGEIDERDN